MLRELWEQSQSPALASLASLPQRAMSRGLMCKYFPGRGEAGLRADIIWVNKMRYGSSEYVMSVLSNYCMRT